MVIFIMVFIAQWTAIVIGSIIQFYRPMPLKMVLANLWLVNFGGVFNAVAYTWVKRSYRSVGQTEASTHNSNA